MDDLLREFLTETTESLDVVDVELVRFEQEPNNGKILGNIFRLVHTIKGTCGFLGLPRLAALAHAAETLMGKFRDGMPVTAEAVSLILATIDRIKEILEALEKEQREPHGTDDDLIGDLNQMATRVVAAGIPPRECDPAPAADAAPFQTLERPLKPGEVSLEELERAFRETPGPSEFDTLPEVEVAAAPQVQPVSGNATVEAVAETDGRDGGISAATKIAHQSIRVNVNTLEKLMTMVSELVLTRNQLLEMARRDEDSEFKVPLQRLSNVTAELQESVMKTRMQPVGNAWQKLPRVVRDLSAELGKEIDLELHGAETELDRQVLDSIKDPLTHMVRNSADHGLETPAERVAAGKPSRGTIRLNARHEGGHILIEIADDGRGLDTQRIKAKAIEKGLISAAQADAMSDSKIQRFIFAPGFSTAGQVTSISGRGVGMDVVLNNIDQIGGSIDVKSVTGEGAIFTIKIPLTLAIISALIIEAKGERFAIPQLAVTELVGLHKGSEHRIEHIKATPVLRLRNRLMPLVYLNTLLNLDGEQETGGDSFVVVTQVANQVFGILVDGILHTEEIVVKPMATKLHHIAMFSGNTILGDGSVIMILDPNGIAAAVGSAAHGASVSDHMEDVEVSSGGATTSLLVFRAGSQEPKAVPLSLVTRLEEVDARRIEVSNGRRLLQYRGQLVPLVAINDSVRIKEEDTQSLLVFSDQGQSMALAVDEIVDIVDQALDIEITGNQPGMLGTAVIKGQATEIIDVGHFLPMAFGNRFGRTVGGAQSAHTLLFVEDSAFFRNMLVPVLKAAGFDVTAASGGQEALALIRSGKIFDIILTDLEMPDVNGFALADFIRNSSCMRNVPLLALSSMISPEMVVKVRNAGFSDFVAKFDRPGLIAALKEQTVEIGIAA